MVSCAQEIDQVMLKVQRAASRAHSLSKKRSDYERALSIRVQQRPRSAAPKDHGCQAKANPHRVARCATRTCLAKGTLGGASDVPAIIFTGSGGWRKPGVASAVSFQAANDGAGCMEDRRCSQEYLEDLRRSEYDSCLKDLSSIGMADADTTASGESDSDMSADQAKPGGEDASGSPVCVESASQPRLVDVQEVGEEEDEANDLEGPSDASPQAPPAMPEDLGRAEASDGLLTKREAALCNLARHLQTQASVERERAEAAEAQQKVLEEKCGEAQPSRAAELKEARRHERQRAASQRRRRNQEAQISALQQKADRALKAAEEAREQAEADAIAARARHLALADAEAQERAEAAAAVEVAKARAEADELVQQRLAELAGIEAVALERAEAEADALRSRAAEEASAARAEALDLQRRAAGEAQALRARAEVEARVIRARAAMEARDLQNELEAKLRAEAEEIAAERIANEVPAPGHGELAGATLRQAKQLQQQQARQHRRRAEQERQREQVAERELRERRARAEEEAWAVRAQALASAEALKAQARQEASAERARLEQQARRRAEEDAEAARSAAEAAAREIKAQAEEQAQMLLAQLEAEQAEARAALEAIKAEASGRAADDCSEGHRMQAVEAEWELLLDDASSKPAEVQGWSVIA